MRMVKIRILIWMRRYTRTDKIKYKHTRINVVVAPTNEKMKSRLR